jgi:hypothetical protein
MATVTITNGRTDVHNQAVAAIDVNTSIGSFHIPMHFDDRGSQERNETYALQQALMFAEQFASALRRRLEFVSGRT